MDNSSREALVDGYSISMPQCYTDIEQKKQTEMSEVGTTVNKWQCLKAATRCRRTSFGRFFTCLLALALSRRRSAPGQLLQPSWMLESFNLRILSVQWSMN